MHIIVDVEKIWFWQEVLVFTFFMISRHVFLPKKIMFFSGPNDKAALSYRVLQSAVLNCSNLSDSSSIEPYASLCAIYA